MMRSRKWILFLFKAIFSLLAIGYVVWELTKEKYDLGSVLAGLNSASVLLIICASVMVILNMGIESRKWQILLKPFYPTLSLWTSMQATLAGMATGLVTPNRIGEYAGRVLFLEEGHRVEAIVVTLVDRLCQMTITMLFSFVAIMILIAGNNIEKLLKIIPMDHVEIWLPVLSGIAVIGLLIVLTQASRISRILEKVKASAKWMKQIRFALRHAGGKTLLIVLLLSALRYAVFTTQYILLMYAFGYEGNVPNAMMMIILVFAGKSLFPILGFAELGVRETIAIRVMSAWTIGATVFAFNSTFVLYLINIIFPSLVGIIFLYRIKLRTDKSK